MSNIKDSLGLENVGIVHRNLDVDSLIKFAIENEGAKVSSTEQGSLPVKPSRSLT
jgi:phosphoenolpyruvate carboxykinase (ATP)